MNKEYTITINWEQLRLIRRLLKERLLKDYELEARADVRACEQLNVGQMNIDGIEIFSLFIIVITLGCMVYINTLTAEEEDDSV